MTDDDRKKPSVDEATAEQTEQQSKRKSVRQILTGGGIVTASALSGEWVKPVSNAVMLPAHGQTTGAGGAGGTTAPPVVAPTPAPGATSAPTGAPTSAPTSAPTLSGTPV